MRFVWLVGLLGYGLLRAQTVGADVNVNSRYTVENVVLAEGDQKTGATAQPNGKLSSKLRHDLLALVGTKLNLSQIDALADRLKKELNAREVRHHLTRGLQADSVRVEFEVRPKDRALNARLTKFVYSSKQGWSGGGEAGITVKHNTLLLGLLSDGDSIAERFAGITGTYENSHLGTDRVSFRFRFEDYHMGWDKSTPAMIETSRPPAEGIYHTRQSLEPTVSVALAGPLTVTAGAAFERFSMRRPEPHPEAANALIASLRYHSQSEQAGVRRNLDAGYSMRLAMGAMGSDSSFNSHAVNFRFQAQRGRHTLIEDFAAGAIGGRAPLSSRFVLGNTIYLRGWNKFDLDPVGGSRMIHNSVEYRFGPVRAFYDSGTVWDQDQGVTLRHSLGIGLKESVFTLAVACPLKGGTVEPILMMGMIY
jgi:hypothetical protein